MLNSKRLPYIMKRPLFWASCAFAAVLVYLVLGYAALASRDSSDLLVYAILPELYREDSPTALPVVDTVAEWLLRYRSSERLKEDLEASNMNQAYLIAALPTLPDLPKPDKVGMARRIAEDFLQRGVYEIDSLDMHGCSSLHNALIARDLDMFAWLVELGADTSIAGTADSKLDKCRLPLSQLLAETTD